MKDLHILGNSIAIIGRKRIWKNFFAWRLAKVLYENWIEELTEISIAYSLKNYSHKPQDFENDNFDYNYLMIDYVNFIKEIIYRNWSIQLSDLYMFSNQLWMNICKMVESQISYYGYELLTDSEKMELIEYFKTLEGYRTRLSLQTFWDNIKLKTNDPFILTTMLLDWIKLNKYAPIVGYINTDTRFISELIDFIIEWFYIILLENIDLNREAPWWEHVSEIELWFSELKVWQIIDIKGPENGEIIDGIKRIPISEFDNKIQKIIPHLLSFRWYSKEDIDEIKKIKEFLKNWWYNFFDLQKQLMKAFVSYKNVDSSEYEKNLENLIDIYNYYSIARYDVLSKINNILVKYY